MEQIIAGYLAPLAAASTLLLLLLPLSRRARGTAPRSERPVFWAPESPRLEVLATAPDSPGAPVTVIVRNAGQERTLRVAGTVTVGTATQAVRAADLWAGEEVTRRFRPGHSEPEATGRASVDATSSTPASAPGGETCLVWALSWRSPSGRRGREEGIAPIRGRAAASSPFPRSPGAVPHRK